MAHAIWSGGMCYLVLVFQHPRSRHRMLYLALHRLGRFWAPDVYAEAPNRLIIIYIIYYQVYFVLVLYMCVMVLCVLCFPFVIFVFLGFCFVCFLLCCVLFLCCV